MYYVSRSSVFAGGTQTRPLKGDSIAYPRPDETVGNCPTCAGHKFEAVVLEVIL